MATLPQLFEALAGVMKLGLELHTKVSGNWTFNSPMSLTAEAVCCIGSCRSMIGSSFNVGLSVRVALRRGEKESVDIRFIKRAFFDSFFSSLVPSTLERPFDECPLKGRLDSKLPLRLEVDARLENLSLFGEKLSRPGSRFRVGLVMMLLGFGRVILLDDLSVKAETDDCCFTTRGLW